MLQRVEEYLPQILQWTRILTYDFMPPGELNQMQMRIKGRNGGRQVEVKDSLPRS